MVYVPQPAVATPFLRIIAMSRGLAPSSPLSFYQSSSLGNFSKEDRRFIQVQLTKKGADLEKDVLNAVEEVNGDVLSVFSQEERSTLKSYLRLLAGVQN